MSQRPLIFINSSQLVTCAGPARARRGKEMAEIGILKNAAVAVSDGRIAMIYTLCLHDALPIDRKSVV